jgi:hypothetical protein
VAVAGITRVFLAITGEIMTEAAKHQQISIAASLIAMP